MLITQKIKQRTHCVKKTHAERHSINECECTAKGLATTVKPVSSVVCQVDVHGRRWCVGCVIAASDLASLSKRDAGTCSVGRHAAGPEQTCRAGQGSSGDVECDWPVKAR